MEKKGLDGQPYSSKQELKEANQKFVNNHLGNINPILIKSIESTNTQLLGLLAAEHDKSKHIELINTFIFDVKNIDISLIRSKNIINLGKEAKIYGIYILKGEHPSIIEQLNIKYSTSISKEIEGYQKKDETPNGKLRNRLRILHGLLVEAILDGEGDLIIEFGDLIEKNGFAMIGFEVLEKTLEIKKTMKTKAEIETDKN
ncbi:MAG: hypothetical protein QM490_01075 [Candidatus Gracilibacteria bacterium]